MTFSVYYLICLILELLRVIILFYFILFLHTVLKLKRLMCKKIIKKIKILSHKFNIEKISEYTSK